MRYPRYKYFYAIVDFISLSFAYYFSFLLYGILFKNPSTDSYFFSFNDIFVLLIVNIMFIIIFHYFHLYKLNVFLTRSRQTVTILKSLIYGIFIILAVSFFFKHDFISDSRIIIALYFNVTFIILILTRVIILNNLYKGVLSKNILRRKILVVGAGKSGQYFAQKLLFEDSLGAQIVGFADDVVIKGTNIFQSLIVLGSTNDLHLIYNEYKIDEIVICIDKIEYEVLMELIDKCKKLNVSVKVSSELFSIIPEKLFSENYENIPVMDFSTKMNVNVYSIFKRIFDFLGASVGLLILSPFFLVTAIIIKLTSKGPIIYKQLRIGKGGKRFNFYKFRSMIVISGEDIERAQKMIDFMKNGKDSESSTKIINNSRVTWIGRILRKYSLDELPQLFNVLLGDMSLVGPRPCLPYEYDHYDEWQKRRLKVIPGCTGLWQVSGRSEVNFNESVIMDIYYINNVTPWLDLQLILKTIPVMVLGKGGK